MKRGILILGLFLVSVLAVFDVVAPGYWCSGSLPCVNLGFDNINAGAGTLDVVVNTSLNVYGFQFALNGVEIIDDSVTAGDMIADWDVVDNNRNSLYGLDFEQDYFDEDGILLNVAFSNYIGPTCFDLGTDINEDGWEDYNVLSNLFGEPLCACWSDVCVGTYCECSCTADPGDLNGDGLWNVQDIVILANCVLAPNCDTNCIDEETGEGNECYGCAGLISEDAGWNILDIVILANCILSNDC